MPKERRDALRAGYRAADKNLHLPRKQISETGTYGIASEEDTGRRVQKEVLGLRASRPSMPTMALIWRQAIPR